MRQALFGARVHGELEVVKQTTGSSDNAALQRTAATRDRFRSPWLDREDAPQRPVTIQFPITLPRQRGWSVCAMIRGVDLKALDQRSRESLLPRTVTFPTAVVLTLWCAARILVVDALAGPLERVEFEGAILRGAVLLGDRIQGYLAKPEGAGPFPVVIGLHGCAGMPDTTKRKLVDELVGWGYVTLLVDSFATRGIDHACTGGVPDIVGKRRSDAYGALAFLARQTFVDPQRVAAVGFSQGGSITLSLAEAISFELFGRPSNLRFRAVVAFYPVCISAGAPNDTYAHSYWGPRRMDAGGRLLR
jgi:hypothetical protein